MKFLLNLDGKTEQIELVDPAPECRFRIGDGPLTQASVETPEPGVYSILLDGRSYDAYVEEAAGTTIVVIDGFRFEIRVEDPRRWKPKREGAWSDDVVTVTAPMPGKVVRVLAAPGDQLDPGQGIVVVEAMKMQNELKAPRAGRVLSLAVKVGDAVSAGELLATIA
jgi:biotin carboxyl carrier protein